MEKHINLLGGLYIAFSIMGIFAGAVVFAVFVGSGLISGDTDAIAITSTVGTIIAVFLFIFALPELIGGIGLLKKKSWSRILVLVLGFLNLIKIPVGTALGIYTIWVLMKDETEKLFVKK